MAIDTDIIERERQFWGASADFYEQWLARDAVMIFPAPVGIMNRDDAIAGLCSGSRWTSVNLFDVAVRRLGEAAVALAYRASAQQAEAHRSYEAYIGSIYVRESGTWKLAFHQHTPLPAQADR